MSVPRVYAAISAITGELSRSGIAKRHTNAQDQYQYRAIDDVYERLSPLLAQHKLCILPRILKRRMTERHSQNDLLVSVSVKAAFDLICAEDGSRHTIESFGEALDAGDKATAKAMTAAYKSAVLQAFCIPASGPDDADAQSHRLKATDNMVEPVQGWARWSEDIIEIVGGCQTAEAIDRCQTTYRMLLRGLAMFDAGLYAGIGEAIRARRAELSRPVAETEPVMKSERRPARRRVRAAPEAANA